MQRLEPSLLVYKPNYILISSPPLSCQWLWLYRYFLTSRCPRSHVFVSTRVIITAIPVPILIELTRMYITIAQSTIVSLRDCCPLMGLMTVMLNMKVCIEYVQLYTYAYIFDYIKPKTMSLK